MLIFRPISESDLPQLLALAGSITGGLTTLPNDPNFLRDRIDESLRAFSPKIKRPGGECYLFVVEDTTTKELMGTAGIAARVGGFEPFYSYEARQERFAHPPLGIEKEMAVLHLKKTHRGPTEICSLFLRPDRRRSGVGRLLSLSRFLFIAAFPHRFDPAIIAELRGSIDQCGRSPFWESVGRHFFERDFSAADFLSGLGNKEFIADLMPEHPIYVALLAPDVQAAIGRVHPDALPARALLEAEGFQPTSEVDIFDAGPQVRAQAPDIRTIKEARKEAIGELAVPGPEGAPRLLANGSLNFRACFGPIARRGDGGLVMGGDQAADLGLGVGDPLWHAPLK